MADNNIVRKTQENSIRFQMNLPNLVLCGVTLLISAVFFIFSPSVMYRQMDDGLEQISVIQIIILAVIPFLTCLLSMMRIEFLQHRRLWGWLTLFLHPLICLIGLEWMNDTFFWSFAPGKVIANYICFLMVTAVTYLAFRRVAVSVIMCTVSTLIFGIADYYTTAFRGTPVLPWDLKALGTAATVMGNYDFVIPFKIACCLLVALLICIASSKIFPVKFGFENISKKIKLTERFVALTIFVVLFIGIFPMDIMASLGVSVWPWNQKHSTKSTGVLAGFFANVQFIMVDKPEGYSVEAVENIKEEQLKKEAIPSLGEPTRPPTVIVVMNESFVDYQSVSKGTLKLTQDNMPFVHELQKSGKVISGTAYSSVFGGNTCDSEFEFLTANSMNFFPIGSKPYQQYAKQDLSSLPRILSQYNYDSIAVHPGSKTAWSRDTAYPYLGFEKFVDASAFHKKRELVRQYTSDKATYDQLIYEYENRNLQNQLFLFGVTIQNHGGFEDDGYPSTVQILDEPGKFPQAEQYLTLIKESDKAFEGLVDYFSKEEEPVVIMMFGDHWPQLEDGFFSKVLGEDYENLSPEDTMRKYEVPFLVWANYPLESKQVDKISLNYLSPLLLQAANLKGTAYTEFVNSVHEAFPVITGVGMFDAEGNHFLRDEVPLDDEILTSYGILQYNNAFDPKHKVTNIFDEIME